MSAGIDFSLHGTLDLITGRRGGGWDGRAPDGDPSLDERETASRAFASRMWSVNTVAPQWNGAGTYDVPQVFGPMPGYTWCISSVVAATFTAGIVNMYRGLPADNNLRFAFTVPGAYLPGGKGLILHYGDRLTFAAAAGNPVTGPVTISLDMIQMTADLEPRFLL